MGATSDGFVRGLFVVGPHAGAHRVAARAGLSVCIPLLIVVLSGHHSWAPYAAFGAFTSLFGRAEAHAQRASMQLSAAASFVAAVTLGSATALLPHPQWSVVVAGSLFTAAVSLISDAFDWHPPGPLFPLFGFAVCAMMPASASNVGIGFMVSAASALFSVVVGYIGVLGTSSRVVPVSVPRPRAARELLNRDGARLHLLRSVLAVGASGATGTLLGGTHPYWAMVAAVAALSGPTMRARVTRGVHRMLGTLVGVFVAGGVLAIHPRGIWAVAVIVLMQIGAELLVGRNYALAVIFITPLALTMGQLGHEVAVGPLLVDRFTETCIGCVISLAVLALLRDRPVRTAGMEAVGGIAANSPSAHR